MIRINSGKKVAASVTAAIIMCVITICSRKLYVTSLNDLHFHLWYFIIAIGCALLTAFLGSVKFELGKRAGNIVGAAVYAASIFGASVVGILFSNGFVGSPYMFFVNVAFYAIVAAIGLLISGSMRASAITAVIVSFLYNFSSFMIYSFRGDALTPTDIYSIKTAMNVAAQYEFKLKYQLITSTIMFIALLMLTFKFPIKLEFKRRKITLRTAAAAAAALGVFFIGSINLKQYDVSVFDQYYANLNYGSAFAFYVNATKMGLEKNEDFDPEKLNGILDGYSEDTTVPEDKPNVIVIMDESFADLRAVGDFNTNEDYMPYFRSLKENTLKGQLMVSPFGGNTCNTEYEFLTGMNVGLLRANAIPYVQMIFNPIPYSMPQHMKKLGYNTLAFHPYFANGWNRTTIYNYMDFDEFVSFENMKKYNEDIEKLRSYPSDKCDFDTVLNYLRREDREPGERDFIFNITMQNHGGYMTANFEPEIKIEGMNGSYPMTEQYLTLIKHTDEALEYFLNELKSFEEPTIVLMFGDHQPNIEKTFYEELYGKDLENVDRDNLNKRYYIPFMIWTNYDSEETEGVYSSPCFLSGLLMERAGLPKSRVQMFLDDVREKNGIRQLNPTGYIDNEGTWHPHRDAKDLKTYYNMEYAILTNEQLNYDFDFGTR